MLPTPDSLVLGNTRLSGVASEVTFVSKPVTIKDAIRVHAPPAQRRYLAKATTAMATSTTALGWGRGCALLSPTVTFGRLTTGSAGRGRVGGLGRSASSA